jgi:hydrogenase/urease accessory protein HupE
MDYAAMLKRGFLGGVALFVIGALGGKIAPMLLGPLPGWEQTLFFDLEVLGILVAFVSPLVFGLVLPLIE